MKTQNNTSDQVPEQTIKLKPRLRSDVRAGQVGYQPWRR
jgi:hypothetical protein